MTQPIDIGVLLMAYGSPNSLEDVEPYYTHIRGGRQPMPAAIEGLRERYKKIGGRSPLLEITRAQARALEERLNATGRRFRVYIGMKHWHPFIAEAVHQMAADGIRRAVSVALAPHYSRMSIGSYIEAVQAASQGPQAPIEFSFIESWNDHPLFLRAVAEKIDRALLQLPTQERPRVPVVFTAHSLPERILSWGDPYPQELQETCQLLVRQLGLTHWRFAYQSAGHTQERWLGPDVKETLLQLIEEQHQQVVICPVGFVSDHLEVLYDIGVECAELAQSKGTRIIRTESLNASPAFIEVLAALVQEQLVP